MIGPTDNDRPTSGSRRDALDPMERNSVRSLRDRVTSLASRSQKSVSGGVATYRDYPAFGLLQHAAEQLPDRDALIYGGERWSYRDLNSDTVRCAAMLQRLGVRP